MDVVKSLRNNDVLVKLPDGSFKFVHHLAADEIDRLRQQVADLIKALEFYANPYCEAECVPDFYSELDFGEIAQDAIAKATGANK